VTAVSPPAATEHFQQVEKNHVAAETQADHISTTSVSTQRNDALEDNMEESQNKNTVEVSEKTSAPSFDDAKFTEKLGETQQVDSKSKVYPYMSGMGMSGMGVPGMGMPGMPGMAGRMGPMGMGFGAPMGSMMPGVPVPPVTDPMNNLIMNNVMLNNVLTNMVRNDMMRKKTTQRF